MLAGFLLDGDVRMLEEASRCMKQLREEPSLVEERQAVEAEALSYYRDKLSQVALN